MQANLNMQDHQKDLLDDELNQQYVVSRKSLLPLWIKIFSWIFLVLSAFVPIALIFGLLGHNFKLELYGLQTSEPLSVMGIFIMTIFIIKGITAFGLLKEKDWGVRLAISDAIVGIIVCTSILLYPLINLDFNFSFRIELVILIPYLIKLMQMRRQWESYSKV